MAEAAEQARVTALRPETARAGEARREPLARITRHDRRSRRQLVRWSLLLGGPALVLAAVGWFWLTGGRYVATDNAYVQADTVQVATDVAGLVKAIAVGDDQHVTRGQILFTLDESTYSRELAPLAGHYPSLRLGPPWWFNYSPEGIRRFRERVTETAGFYNTVGFNDDTRAFPSIPARHDVARRMDCGFLASLVADHRIQEDEAVELARDLAYTLAKQAYRL